LKVTILGGADGNSTQFAPGGNTPNFYIGQLGYADTPYFTTPQSCGQEDGFNSTLAGSASYVYGFWMLHGPKATPSRPTDYEWGQRQGNAAVKSWVNQQCVKQVTIFADVEHESGGVDNEWFYSYETDPTSAEQDGNFNVLLGFGNALIHPASPYDYLSLKLGVYCSPTTWSIIMGSHTLAQAYATAAWTWRNRNFSSFPTTWQVNGAQENPQSFGGLEPVFWQYDVTTTEDYDACQGYDYLPG